MKPWQSISLVVASLLAAGCSELETVPTEPPHDATPRIALPSDSARAVIAVDPNAPDDVPAEFIGHSTWLDVSVDVGWSSPTTAYGQAIMKYWASNATVAIDLSVRNDKGTVVGQNSASVQDGWPIPWRSTLYASTSVTVAGTCGQIAQARATGNVWDSALSSSKGFLSWGNKSGSATNSTPQPACAPPTCADTRASNYGGALPCTYPPPPPPTSGADGTTPTGPSGPPTDPPYEEAGPMASNGHYECVIYFRGTDHEWKECTWHDDSARIGLGRPTLSRTAIDRP